MYTIGVDTPSGVGAWGADGPLFATSTKGMDHAAATVQRLVEQHGKPIAIIIEKPHGVGEDEMYKQQAA